MLKLKSFVVTFFDSNIFIKMYSTLMIFKVNLESFISEILKIYN